MWDYCDKIRKVRKTDEHCHQKDYTATAHEEANYRSLAGTMMYLGNASLPQTAMMAYRMKKLDSKRSLI